VNPFILASPVILKRLDLEMNMKKQIFAAFAAMISLGLFACSTNSDGDTRTTAYTQMTVTEVMYHGTNSVEFIELKAKGKPIASMKAVNLRIEGAVYYAFPDEALDTTEYIVVTNDTAAFRTNYPNFTGRLFGPWQKADDDASVGSLSNDGDVIEVKIDGKGDVDARFDDDPPWPSKADGLGSSLVLVGSNAAYVESWAASKAVGGNPGSGDDSVYNALTVRVNEVMPYGNGDSTWVELYNSGSSAVDVGGWKLAVSNGTVIDTIEIPSGKSVPATDYLVLSAADLGSAFAPAASGGDIYLFEVAGGALTGSETSLQYAGVPAGKTAGFEVFTDGSMQEGTLVSVTPGAANAEIAVGDVCITEVYYNPPDGNAEFMEIQNTGTADVDLSSWKVEGIGLTFASGVTIGAGKTILLLPASYVSADGVTSVTLDTASYRKASGIDSSIHFIQYSGKLSNRGELVAVKEPASTGTYYLWSDAILYSDDGYWPSAADGNGSSLHRVSCEAPGYEPGNWKAASPTPAKAF
jgi:hypothetical protein